MLNFLCSITHAAFFDVEANGVYGGFWRDLYKFGPVVIDTVGGDLGIFVNDEFILINETGDSSIRRYWLKGSKKGTSDYFIRGLPGYPDNISFDENGIFWVAFAGIRSPLVDGLSNFPTIRKILGGLPKILLSPVNKHVFILGLDVEGNVIFNLHDKESDINVLTSANFFGNKLYIGNLASNFIATIDLKNLEIKNIN